MFVSPGPFHSFVDNNRTSWVVGAYLVLAEHVEAQEKVDSAVVFQHCER